MMKWFYLKKKKWGLALIEEFPARPGDALEEKGDPARPWYKKEEHEDDEHIHLQAHNDKEAWKKGMKLFERDNL